MGEKQSRSVSLGRDEKWGRTRKRRGIRSRRIRGLRPAMMVLSVLAALAQAPLGGRVGAQETPAKKGAVARPEAPPESGRGEAGQESEPVTAEVLSARYRFIERYSATEDPNHPELITQYRVGIREIQKTVREKPQGAPDQAQISRQTIYTERTAQVGKLGEMMSAIRRYDKFSVKEPAASRPHSRPLFDGLTILLRRQTGQKPKVLSLIPDRALREYEFAEITKQVIVPQLTALLPPTPKRVGDTWTVSRPAAHCLVGEVPDADDYELTGKLIEVRKTASGPGLTAIIGVSGQMNLTLGLSSLNAQLQFAFEPPAGVPPAAGSAVSPKAADEVSGKSRDKLDAGIVDARGRMTRFLMLWAVSDVIPDGDGRLKQTTTYELNLERRLASAASEAAGGQNAALAVPDPLPTPTEANSWLVYEDPLQRFHFRHPQELIYRGTSDSNSVPLVENHPKGDVLLTIDLQPKDAGRQMLDPEYHRRELSARWAKEKRDVLKGSTGWLPDAEWSPLKRKVYRIEAALIPKGDTPVNADRLYLDYYLVLFTTNESIVVTALTEQESNLKLRAYAEGIIKNFHFGKPDGQPKAPAVPSPAPK